MTKKIISLTLLIIWMVCIFAFSAQPAEESSARSDKVKAVVMQIVERIFPSALHATQSADGSGLLVTLIRKSAHFLAYLMLGVLAFWTFSSWGIQKRYTLSFVLCILYAVSDEIHQIFVPGRAGRIFDVFIDSMGAALGLVIIFLFKKWKKCLTK